MKNYFNTAKIGFLTGLILLTSTLVNAEEMLSGFRYANEQAPSGKEWESPENLALNKEQPRAYFFRFRIQKVPVKFSPKIPPTGNRLTEPGSSAGQNIPTNVPWTFTNRNTT